MTTATASQIIIVRRRSSGAYDYVVSRRDGSFARPTRRPLSRDAKYADGSPIHRDRIAALNGLTASIGPTMLLVCAGVEVAADSCEVVSGPYPYDRETGVISLPDGEVRRRCTRPAPDIDWYLVEGYDLPSGRRVECVGLLSALRTHLGL